MQYKGINSVPRQNIKKDKLVDIDNRMKVSEKGVGKESMCEV